MKRLTKTLTFALLLALIVLPTVETQAKTKTLNISGVTSMINYKDNKEVKVTGNYKVSIVKAMADNQAYVTFTAPKAGVYQIKLSNLHCKTNKQGINTSVNINTVVLNKRWNFEYGRTCYFANAKTCDNVYLMSKYNYNFQMESSIVDAHPEFLKSVIINCKLKKGEHLSISFGNFDGLDGLYSRDTYVFNMSIKKK